MRSLVKFITLKMLFYHLRQFVHAKGQIKLVVFQVKFFQYNVKYLVLAQLFVKVPRPEDSEVTFLVFDSTTSLITQT